MYWVFLLWSILIFEFVVSVGFFFFLFFVGFEFDLNVMCSSGKKVLGMVVVGLFFFFIFGIGVVVLLSKVMKMLDSMGYVEYFLFIGVLFFIIVFLVLVCILVEFKLFMIWVGEIVMVVVVFNDVVVWILFFLVVVMVGGVYSFLVFIWVFLFGFVFVGFMMVVVWFVMNWVVMKWLFDYNIIDEGYMCLILVVVMVFGFLIDFMGIYVMFGVFMFGLMMFKSGELVGMLIKSIEDFVFGFFLFLYFVLNGLKIDVGKMKGVVVWGFLVVVILFVCVGKILGMFMVVLLCIILVSELLMFGLLMNIKGLVELVVFNIGSDKKVMLDFWNKIYCLNFCI